ncbi:MAG: ABC transporter permease [Acidobacteria bacterium]|nr:ABC transporter permease [Acidobacteriota bacterium]
MGRVVRGVGASIVVLGNILSEAVASLRSRRMQAALSSFGIATGITAVVLLVSIVSGIHRFMLETLGVVGGNVIQVTASSQRSTRDPRGFAVTAQPADVETILQSSAYFDIGSAENYGYGVIRTTRRSTQGSSVRGLTQSGFDILDVHVARGRLFLEGEYADGSRVAVLGADVAVDLFNQESPIGQTIVIGEWPFVVSGVLAWIGDPTAGVPAPPDRFIYVPFKACAAAFKGNENAGMLRLRLRSPDTADAAVAEAKRILDRQRKQRGETSGEFQVINTIERMAQLNMVLTTLKFVVGLVGGIGLFVGAVGVANVMLVSVRERRQEIGVRRALGATRRAIFIGFLFEGLAITLSGGLAGILIAWALTGIAVFIPQVPAGARPHISLVTASTSIALLTLVGLVAGVGPARRAASVDPAEALRAD